MLTLEEALDRNTEYKAIAPVGSVWLHGKTEHVYFIEKHTVREHDLCPCVVYTRWSDHSLCWVRPTYQFLDGRFKRMEN